MHVAKVTSIWISCAPTYICIRSRRKVQKGPTTIEVSYCLDGSGRGGEAAMYIQMCSSFSVIIVCNVARHSSTHAVEAGVGAAASDLL